MYFSYKIPYLILLLKSWQQSKKFLYEFQAFIGLKNCFSL